MLFGADAEQARFAVRVSRLRTTAGEPIPEPDWPTVPGAKVLVTEEWVYPDEQDTDDGDPEPRDDGEDGGGYGEPVKAYLPVWVVTDSHAAEQAGFTVPTPAALSTSPGHRSGQAEAETEEQAEARRDERRRVIANNKAWGSAQTVRREWLAGFLTRKTPPKGAEALICEAVLTGQHSLYKALEANHPMLRRLLGVAADKTRWDSHAEVAGIGAKATTPKAATITALAAVVAAWEDSTGRHTWRNPTAWDARVLAALTEWGYQASDVESLLLGQPDPQGPPEPASDQGGDQAAGDSAS